MPRNRLTMLIPLETFLGALRALKVRGGGVLRGWRGSYPELEFRKIIVKRKVNPPLVFRQNPGDLETNNSPSFPRWESSIRMQGRGVIRDRWCTAAKGPNVLCSSTGGNGPANSFDPESVKNYLDFSPGGLPGVSEHRIPLLYPPPQRHHKHTTHLGVHVVAGQGALGYTLPWVGGTAHPPAPPGGGGRGGGGGREGHPARHTTGVYAL